VYQGPELFHFGVDTFRDRVAMSRNLSPAQGSGRSLQFSAEETSLVAALRQGDETAFATLVDRYHAALLRLATAYVSDRAVAEEVVQETWLALVRGIDRFEERCTLKTWLYRVLVYQARHRIKHEERIVTFSAVESSRFLPAGDEWAGHWSDGLASWDDLPEEQMLSKEAMAHIESLIADLPPRQRAVIVLRDVEGLEAAEVCDVLGLTDSTQRVLLHRARSRVRRGVERYLVGA
jgi:RNA polymerase sigma-70 factor (ECF subfamily)